MLFFLVKFQNITGLEIVEIFQTDAAFKTGSHFFDIIFKTPQTDDGGIGQYLSLADYSDRQVAADFTFGDIAAGDFGRLYRPGKPGGFQPGLQSLRR